MLFQPVPGCAGGCFGKTGHNGAAFFGTPAAAVSAAAILSKAAESAVKSNREAWTRSSREAPRIADRVIVARVTYHSPEISSRILGSSAVADAVERVAGAGCEVQPEWACGAGGRGGRWKRGGDR